MDSAPNRVNQQLLDVFKTFALFPSGRFGSAEARRGARAGVRRAGEATGGVNPHDFGHHSSNRNFPSLPFHESALLMSRLYPRNKQQSCVGGG